jgi:hypothetical protein
MQAARGGAAVTKIMWNVQVEPLFDIGYTLAPVSATRALKGWFQRAQIANEETDSRETIIRGKQGQVSTQGAEIFIANARQQLSACS